MPRAIVSIKKTGKGSGKSGLTRYIAESKRDFAREGLEEKERRPLFSDRDDRLTYSAANQFLSRGNNEPANEDIIHLVISSEPGDFERLGTTLEERKERFREVTREAMRELETELGVERLFWVAGIHLNTDNPHVHFAIDRDAVDRRTGLHLRLEHIPRRLLTHNEKQRDGMKKTVPGRIAEVFTVSLDNNRIPVRSIQIESHSKDLDISREIVSSRTLEYRNPYPQERTVGDWLLAEIDLARTGYSGEERAELESRVESLRAEVARIDKEAANRHEQQPAAFLEPEKLEAILREPPASLVVIAHFGEKGHESPPARARAAAGRRDQDQPAHDRQTDFEHASTAHNEEPLTRDLIEEYGFEADLSEERAAILQMEAERGLTDDGLEPAPLLLDEFFERDDGTEHEMDFGMEADAQSHDASAQTQPHDDNWKDRYILGRSMVARAQTERLLNEYKSVTEHGDKRRFLVYDETWGRTRRISDFDIRRRGDARAGRETYEQGITHREARDGERQERFEGELERHAKGLHDHRIILDKTAKKLEEKLKIASSLYDGLRPRAQAIQSRYRAAGGELPLPIVTRDELREIQDLAIAAGKPERVLALERIRQGLMSERGEPSRIDRESARLSGQLLAARNLLASRESRAEQFERTHHVTRWEIDGEKFSLAELDRRISDAADRSQVFGQQINFLPSERSAATAELARLAASREQLLEKIEERRDQLQQDVVQTTKMVDVLGEIQSQDASERARRGLPSAGIEMTRPALNQMEQHALQTRDAVLLERFYLLEESYEEKLSAGNKPSLEKSAARARGRETIAEISLSEAEEQLLNFEERMPFVPVVIKDADGKEKTARLWDYRVNRNPLTATLDRLFESRERSEERRTVEHLVREQHAHLQDERERARACLEFTRSKSAELRARLGADGREVPPAAFTPKQINQIEIYAARHHDRGVRERLESLIEAAETSGHILLAERERRSPSGSARETESPLERNARQNEEFPHAATMAGQAPQHEARQAHQAGRIHTHDEEHPLTH